MTSIVCLGEALIDFFPAEIGKPLAEVSAFLPMPGGAPANVAVAVARLGGSSAFVGAVGDDAWGHHLAAVLAREGVNIQGLRFLEEARTGINFHAMPDAQRAEHLFYRHPSADQRLTPEDLDERLLRHARALHIGSISLLNEPARSATLRAIELARAGRALISYDVNYRPDLLADPRVARRLILRLLPDVDMVKVNEDEAYLLTASRRPEEVLDVLLEAGPSLAVLTLGARGCVFACEGSRGRVPGYVTDVVDAVGCGDAFMAALLCSLVAGEGDWREHLRGDLCSIFRYANAAGALTGTQRGALPALPTAESVARFLRASAQG
jgi:fructokinase